MREEQRRTIEQAGNDAFGLHPKGKCQCKLCRFDKAKNQLKADVLKHYGEAAGWKRWNKIDHLKPIYILDYFPELKAKLPTARINELQVISDEGR